MLVKFQLKSGKQFYFLIFFQQDYKITFTLQKLQFYTADLSLGTYYSFSVKPSHKLLYFTSLNSIIFTELMIIQEVIEILM